MRSAKVKQTQDTFDTTYGAGKVEVVPLDDLIVADFTSALKGMLSKPKRSEGFYLAL